MFTWLNKQGVKSDCGFVVQFTGRFTAEYHQNGKTATLSIENGIFGGLPCIIVDPGAFERWDGDPPTNRISKNQRNQLFKNLKEAIEFQGLAMVIEKGESPTGQ